MKITESKFEPGIEIILHSKCDDLNSLRSAVNNKNIHEATILYASMDHCIYSVTENKIDSDIIIFNIGEINDEEIAALKDWIECNGIDNMKEAGKSVIIDICIDRDIYVEDGLCELMDMIPTHFLYSIQSKYFSGKVLFDLEDKEIYNRSLFV